MLPQAGFISKRIGAALAQSLTQMPNFGLAILRTPNRIAASVTKAMRD
jgi:hypothetical protein